MDMPEMDRRLASMRVLVVEDNFLVAMAVERALTERGCVVLGPVASVVEGSRMAAEGDIHGAILDVNILGGTSQAIAETLEQRGVPFVFMTGYGSPQMLPERLKRMPRLTKPVDALRMLEMVAERFGGQG